MIRQQILISYIDSLRFNARFIPGDSLLLKVSGCVTNCAIDISIKQCKVVNRKNHLLANVRNQTEIYSEKGKEQNFSTGCAGVEDILIIA